MRGFQSQGRFSRWSSTQSMTLSMCLSCSSLCFSSWKGSVRRSFGSEAFLAALIFPLQSCGHPAFTEQQPICFWGSGEVHWTFLLEFLPSCHLAGRCLSNRAALGVRGHLHRWHDFRHLKAFFWPQQSRFKTAQFS